MSEKYPELERNIRLYLRKINAQLEFEYNGSNCLIIHHPETFCMNYFDEIIFPSSVDEVMTTKFFDGKSLEDIFDEIVDNSRGK